MRKKLVEEEDLEIKVGFGGREGIDSLFGVGERSSGIKEKYGIEIY